MENHRAINGNINELNGHFQYYMLNYQRVQLYMRTYIIIYCIIVYNCIIITVHMYTHI